MSTFKKMFSDLTNSDFMQEIAQELDNMMDGASVVETSESLQRLDHFREDYFATRSTDKQAAYQADQLMEDRDA